MSVFEPFRGPGDTLQVIQGPDLASGTTIAPVAYITRVTGTSAIDTITLPYSNFSGTIVLLPTAAFTTTTNGNVIIASTAVIGKALYMTYSQQTSKWYPSY